MNPEVDQYLIAGCGRCPLANTPGCKVHRWQEVLETLRTILLASGLTEDLKWGVPCYTFEKKNVALLSAFKEYAALSFMKGALLQDPEGMLQQPGEHTQSVRLLRFTDVREVRAQEANISAYILEAIALEKDGQKVAFKKADVFDIPEEFQQKLQTDPVLRAAFFALTPGRQRGYLLHFAAPKQAQTRLSRIEKCMPRIFEGKGLNE